MIQNFSDYVVGWMEYGFKCWNIVNTWKNDDFCSDGECYVAWRLGFCTIQLLGKPFLLYMGMWYEFVYE